MLTNLPATDIFLKMKSDFGNDYSDGVEGKLNVLGGYMQGGKIVFLVRDSSSMTVEDYLLRINPEEKTCWKTDEESDCLLEDDWVQFQLLKENGQFRMGGSTWRKMDTHSMKLIVEKDLFHME